MNQTLRTILIGAITAIAVAVLLKAQQSAGPSGRFQLVTGSYTISGKDGLTTQNATAFKLNSTTGQTWFFVTGIDKDGKYYGSWSPIQQQ